MEILLDELKKIDFSLEKYHDRKTFLDNQSYQICGITQSGKTKLVKNYLSSLKKNSYLYIDCNDERIDVATLNLHLGKYCHSNNIETLVLDNYKESIHFVNVSQLIIITEEKKEYAFLKTLLLHPLDYEEFLTYEYKYDSTALNHYLQLGSLPVMHKLPADERVLYIQKKLKCALSSIEFEILKFVAKLNTTALSTFTIYERLKQKQKISKDKTYTSYKSLVAKRYMYELEKFNQPKAIKKLYLADIFFKTALSTDKHFGRLFENMIFLELVKKEKICYYYDGIDFYLPDEDTIILCKPFADERRLFQKLESIEAFLFSYKVQKVIAITMSKEATISHPLSHVEMVPFDIWALGD
jgi:hypothetical protein